MAIIDYYFYGASPFSYLGHGQPIAVAQQHGAEINYKPVNLFAVWEVSGAVPPAKRPLVRQRYRLIELQRVAEFRGLPINIHPKYWPADTTLADQAVIALVEAGHAPADYMQRVFSGVWADELDLADRSVVAGLLSDCGFDAEAILERAGSDDVAAIRAQNSKDAVAADAVGVPAYVLNGEVFWGQDRIELLDHALKTGRAAYTA
ncbi:MAG: 2-hydroxychromene-2-carboxylate isomerase [Pseudomonadota bacterium]